MRSGKQPPEIVRDFALLLMELPPGDPHDCPAGRLKAPVATTIRLEGGARSMHLVAVQLDDHPLIVPTTIHLHPYPADHDRRVRLRGRQAGHRKKGQKAVLEGAARKSAGEQLEGLQATPRSETTHLR